MSLSLRFRFHLAWWLICLAEFARAILRLFHLFLSAHFIQGGWRVSSLDCNVRAYLVRLWFPFGKILIDYIYYIFLFLLMISYLVKISSIYTERKKKGEGEE